MNKTTTKREQKNINSSMFPTVVSFAPPYRQLVVDIVSSKLKSAPEHTGISQEVLQYMQELCRPGSIDPFLASSFFLLFFSFFLFFFFNELLVNLDRHGHLCQRHCLSHTESGTGGFQRLIGHRIKGNIRPPCITPRHLRYEHEPSRSFPAHPRYLGASH